MAQDDEGKGGCWRWLCVLLLMGLLATGFFAVWLVVVSVIRTLWWIDGRLYFWLLDAFSEHERRINATGAAVSLIIISLLLGSVEPALGLAGALLSILVLTIYWRKTV